MSYHLCLRIDQMNPLLHDIYFVFADRLMGSDDLAVDIRQTDLVIVNEIKGADSAAGKGFDDIAADSADPEDGDTGVVKTLHGIFAEE